MINPHGFDLYNYIELTTGEMQVFKCEFIIIYHIFYHFILNFILSRFTNFNITYLIYL